MADTFELILILVSLIIGMLSALYFYESTDIFTGLLQKPLKYISTGFIMIMFGVLIAVFILYQEKLNNAVYLFNFIPLQALFFLLYIVGSIFIYIGARQFSVRPR